MFLLDLWRGQKSPDVWIDAFCDLVLKWKPQGWAEEQGQIKSAIGPFLDKRISERRAYVTRAKFPTKGDKSIRAQSIRVVWRSRAYLFRLMPIGIQTSVLSCWDFRQLNTMMPPMRSDSLVRS
jgi:hypothetical protein